VRRARERPGSEGARVNEREASHARDACACHMHSHAAVARCIAVPRENAGRPAEAALCFCVGGGSVFFALLQAHHAVLLAFSCGQRCLRLQRLRHRWSRDAPLFSLMAAWRYHCPLGTRWSRRRSFSLGWPCQPAVAPLRALEWHSQRVRCSPRSAADVAVPAYPQISPAFWW